MYMEMQLPCLTTTDPKSRQHGGARTGLAHMVGVEAVCCAHVLSK